MKSSQYHDHENNGLVVGTEQETSLSKEYFRSKHNDNGKILESNTSENLKSYTIEKSEKVMVQNMLDTSLFIKTCV